LKTSSFAMTFAGGMRMPFADRLSALRKTKGLTQQQLAERVGLHQSQIHRYESGSSEPSMDALRRLALALGVTTDQLVFEEGEREVADELRLQFEAISRFDPEDRKAARAFLDVLILKHEAKRWASAS
jgi:transcriptional regulator with XRE-family HTH domain